MRGRTRNVEEKRNRAFNQTSRTGESGGCRWPERMRISLLHPLELPVASSTRRRRRRHCRGGRRRRRRRRRDAQWPPTCAASLWSLSARPPVADTTRPCPHICLFI